MDDACPRTIGALPDRETGGLPGGGKEGVEFLNVGAGGFGAVGAFDGADGRLA